MVEESKYVHKFAQSLNTVRQKFTHHTRENTPIEIHTVHHPIETNASPSGNIHMTVHTYKQNTVFNEIHISP
jgi:hypothetical protein